jgi:GT2 family glycosyltransferase
MHEGGRLPHPALNRGPQTPLRPLRIDIHVAVHAPRRSSDAAWPTLSLIVPTHNRRERLSRLLSALERHHKNGVRFEVVVAVDGANDGTEAMLSSLRASYPLRVVVQPQRGAAAARNAAIAVATGDVLLFVDDDVVPGESLLERHLLAHRLDPSAAVIGRMAAPPGRKLPVWLDWEATILDRLYERLVARQVTPGWQHYFTSNASVRRSDAVAVGGFDERFTRAQDIEFASRLAARGVRFRFLSDAVVHHDPDKTLEIWLRLAFERGRFHLLLTRQDAGARGYSMQNDWQHLHPLNRLLAKWCLGHAHRTRVVVGALKRAIGSPYPSFRRFQLLICSALFNIKYWEGAAEATGPGPSPWLRAEPARR